MGKALPILPYTMPFVADPMRTVATSPNAVFFQVPSNPLSEVYAFHDVDAFMPVDEASDEVFSTRTSQGLGMRFFSPKTSQGSASLPSEERASTEETSMVELDHEPLHRFLKMVAEGRIHEIEAAEGSHANAFLKALVLDEELECVGVGRGLSDPQSAAVFYALLHLSEKAGASCLTFLQDVLNDTTYTEIQQLKALEALRHVPGADIVPTILEFLSSADAPSHSVRLAAISMLDEYADMRAIPALMSILENPLCRERQAAITAVGGIFYSYRAALSFRQDDAPEHVSASDAERIWKARTALEDIAFNASEDAELRSEALIALGKLGVPDVFMSIAGLVERFMRSREASGAAAAGVSSEEVMVIQGAIEALGWLGNPNADDIVIAVVEDRDLPTSMRVEALETLSIFETPQSVMALQRMMAHEDDPLRLEVVNILKTVQLGDNGDRSKN